MQWYYAENDQQIGPVSDEEFQELVNTGTIQPATLVWNETMTDWTPYAEIGAADMAQEAVGASFKRCSECGQAFSPADMISYENAWVCASCKPVFIQKLKEGVNVGAVMEYAGFWIRFGALVIDIIILWFVNILFAVPAGILMVVIGASAEGSDDVAMGLAMLFQLVLMVLQIAVAVGYETWFIGKYAATPGKMACRIKVITSDGDKVSYLRAFGRYFARQLNKLTLGIGYLIVAFDDEKRGLHDHICDTRVVMVF